MPTAKDIGDILRKAMGYPNRSRGFTRDLRRIRRGFDYTAGAVPDAVPDAAALFDPLVFPCGVVSPNRVWLAPLTNGQSHDDGTLADEELRWLVRRADGGFGAIMTCAAYVGADGKGWRGELGVDDDRDVPGLRQLADEVHARGSLCLAQIFHGGVRSPSALSGGQPWSAGTWVEEAADFEAPRVGDERDIERVIAQFGAAARRCAEAGMDGVEIHGAHGYLPSQFLSRLFNQREDRWGGAPLENRARLMREIVRAVRAAAPGKFAVGVRLSPEDFGHARGLDLDENVQVAQWLCDDGVDFVHLSLWRAERMTVKRPAEHAVSLFRAAMPSDVPIVAAGAIWSVGDACAAIERGAACVALGRSAIVNPDWPRDVRAARGRGIADAAAWEPRRPPLTPEDYAGIAVSPRFVEYLRRFKNMVSEG
ncbi:MAG TPA: NADH:flavin oxidoreductase [Kofleriaceae bacterium]|nr:NADH:flavin oxidoreductase [Kofleriaceae bacterium]